MLEAVINNIWAIMFLIWGLPLSFYRSKFRKIVYQTDDWKINIKPLFDKEVKGLFRNIYPNHAAYLKNRNFYLFIFLFILYYS
jgi:peroxiredoxin Q/BCP